MPRSVPWDVYLHGKHIDTVWFEPDMTEEDVLRSLIGHDGYDNAIRVVKSK